MYSCMNEDIIKGYLDNDTHVSYSDEHSRVSLDIDDGDPNSDYINANYLSVSSHYWKYMYL